MLLGFDKQQVNLNIESNRLIAELLPNKVNLGLIGAEEVERALDNPIGT